MRLGGRATAIGWASSLDTHTHTQYWAICRNVPVCMSVRAFDVYQIMNMCSPKSETIMLECPLHKFKLKNVHFRKVIKKWRLHFRSYTYLIMHFIEFIYVASISYEFEMFQRAWWKSVWYIPQIQTYLWICPFVHFLHHLPLCKSTDGRNRSTRSRAVIFHKIYAPPLVY